MNCERCGERPAEVRYTELRDGESHKLRLCHECADELGFRLDPESLTSAQDPTDPPVEENPGLILSVVATGSGKSATVPEKSEYDAVRCSGCGVTGAQLRTQVLLGCPKCYETFAGALEDVIRKMHGAVSHRGRLPGGRSVSREDPTMLEARLAEAIADEDFEEAARLRNRLRKAGGSS